jgi:hypothetical protein
MTPEDIKNTTVTGLQQAAVKMTSPEWEAALAGKPEEMKAAAARTLTRAKRYQLKLENAQLDAIAKALAADEKELTAGKANLDNALADLKEVQKVIDNVTVFLVLVSRILEAAARSAA